MFQMKEQDKTGGRELNKTEASNLSEIEFKTLVIRVLVQLHENFKKEIGSSKKKKKGNHNKEPFRNNWNEEYTKQKQIQWNRGENTQSEQKKIKNEYILRELWANIKHNNTHIIGVPEGEEREQGIENLFEEIMPENFPNQMKEIDTQD